MSTETKLDDKVTTIPGTVQDVICAIIEDKFMNLIMMTPEDVAEELTRTVHQALPPDINLLLGVAAGFPQALTEPIPIAAGTQSTTAKAALYVALTRYLQALARQHYEYLQQRRMN